MVRAAKVAWLGMVVGLAAAGETRAPQPVMAGTTTGAEQAGKRPNGHTALNAGIDSYRRGDYEKAATFFAQAQAGASELKLAEQQELANLIRLNAKALQARQEAHEQLVQTEAAVAQGRYQQAEALLKSIGTNQFLSAADRAKAQQLSAALRGGAGRRGGHSGAAAPGILARTKLRQARALMARVNYDAAEALAREAGQIHVGYGPGEDTPRRVLEDIAKIRSDPKGLLAAARAALQRGDVDDAELLARQADKAASAWTFPPWKDTPSKVLKDAKARRATMAATGAPHRTLSPGGRGQGEAGSAAKPATAAEEEPSPYPQIASHPATRDMPVALEKPQKLQALGPQQDDAGPRKGVGHALPERPDEGFGQKAPDPSSTPKESKLPDQPIQAAAESAPDRHLAQARQPAELRAPTVMSKGDPRTQLKLARELYEAGQLDEAEKLAKAARAGSPPRWGLFEDTPDKLLIDIHTARVKRQRQDSAQVLAEARRLFVQGKLEEAKQKAQLADQLHGKYSIWYLGDRPQKLIADIETAQAKQRQLQPPRPPAAVVQKDGVKDPSALAGLQQPVVSPAGQWRSSQQAPPPTVINLMPVADKKDPALEATEPGAGRAAEVARAPGSPGAATPPEPDAVAAAAEADPAKQQAQQLLLAARQLQKEGRLIEARQEALAAQKIGAAFGGEEDSPEQTLQQLAGLASTRIDSLMQQATDLAVAGYTDPASSRKAEDDLTQALQLARGFGLDSQPIYARLAWTRQTRDKMVAAGPLATQPGSGDVATPPGPISLPPTAGTVVTDQQRGNDLLERARLELRSGETGNARRLAEEAYKEKYSVQAEAAALLRTIAAEEYNQRALAANRSFDAGLSLYQRQDYAQALNIFRTLDPQLLRQAKRDKLRELMLSPEMQSRPAIQPVAHTEPDVQKPDAGRASASDAPGQARVGQASRLSSPEESYAQQVQDMQDVRFQKLRQLGIQAQQDATERFRTGNADQALGILQNYLLTLRDSPLEPERVALLRRPIDSRLQQFQMLKAQQELARMQTASRDNWNREHQAKLRAEEAKQKRVAELMKQSNELYNEGKHREAEVAAMKALDLDPDNTQAAAAVKVARMHANLDDYRKHKDEKEKLVLAGLNDTDDEGPSLDIHHPEEFDAKRWEIAIHRKPAPAGIDLPGAKTPIEREIERKLLVPVNLDFKDTPLSQVIDDLRRMNGINIVTDKPALEEANIALDQLITMRLEEAIPLRSALNHLLSQARLTCVIQDDVLLITTEEHAKGKLMRRVYQVADLVIPVENHKTPPSADFQQALMQASGRPAAYNNTTMGRGPLQGGTPVTSGGTQPESTSPWASNLPTQVASAHAPGQTIQDVLMDLITNTIKPESWSKMGGPGTIDYYPLGMALVVNQTPDIQEQIVELLAALRRLQDQEMTVEVRFISLSESFYERIGLDFSVNILTHNTKYEPQIVTQNFAPPGFINSFRPAAFLTGLSPGGPAATGSISGFTPDLNIPIHPNSFSLATPPFGGFAGAPPDGGISLGLAFLSDIQVFMFMEAAQADSRTNVMQAPKLTLFNGQTSTIDIADVIFFATNADVLPVGNQLTFVAHNNPLPGIETALTIQGVISADRRYVRLSLTPTLMNLTTPVVPLFPVEVLITPMFDGGAVGQPLPFIQYLQQPAFTMITVNTTVNVPDGGTVVLGGLKVLREGRNEFGPPILSKIPYINRLFKNVGYGREAESLLIMVTPRIIINEEEESLFLEGRPSLLGQTVAPGQPGP